MISLLIMKVWPIRPQICLTNQLTQLSRMLIIINRRNGTSFMTNDLYSDIQSTIQDSFVCASYFENPNPECHRLLYLLGIEDKRYFNKIDLNLYIKIF